mmetsp:Transcript_89184/g.273126  ORF Transcript_89184/g.273126 Transcript_89184/m.273126 type:complete len:207 (-) Transcript_89184:838-1458(-)
MNCLSLSVIFPLLLIFSSIFLSPSFFSIVSCSFTASKYMPCVHECLLHKGSSHSSVLPSSQTTLLSGMVFWSASTKSDWISANSGAFLGVAFPGRPLGFSPGTSLMSERSIGKKSSPLPPVHCAHIKYNSALTDSSNPAVSSLSCPLLAKPLETTKWKTWRNKRPSNKSQVNNFTSSWTDSCMSLPMTCETWSKYRAKAALDMRSS